MSHTLLIKNLSGGYNQTDIVKSIDLVLEKGTLVGLIGENGSGKTTLLNTLYDFTDHCNGEIHLNGTNLIHEKSERLQKLGIMYGRQEGLIFKSLTVREHLALLAKCSGFDERMKQFQSYFPELEALYDKRGGNLSGGERKLVTLSMINASDAIFWLLDEPVAGLSEERTERVRDFLLYKLKQGIGILIIEHKMNIFLGCLDYLYEMREGNLMKLNSNMNSHNG